MSWYGVTTPSERGQSREWRERQEKDAAGMIKMLERDRRILQGLVKRWQKLGGMYLDLPAHVEDAMALTTDADDSLARAINNLNEGDFE